MLSLNEKLFISKAINIIRLDGRAPKEYRSLKLTNTFIDKTNEGIHPIIQTNCYLGKTQVMSKVSARISTPNEKRPKEGKIFFHVYCFHSAKIDIHYRNKKRKLRETEGIIKRELERIFKKNRIVDFDALCIIPGEKVWYIDVEVTVFNNSGNAMEASFISVLTSFIGFKLQDFTFENNKLRLFSSYEKNLLPFALRAYPICVTICISLKEFLYVFDPTIEEEHVFDTILNVCCDTDGRIISFSKIGGQELLFSETFINSISEMCIKRVRFVYEEIKNSMNIN